MERTNNKNLEQDVIMFRISKTQKAIFQQMAKEKNITLTKLILESLINNK